jgi:TIR domain
MNAKIFINYRREDTRHAAGRLCDHLIEHFGKDQVFMDIDQIDPGEDFVEVINRKVATCDIAIVMIGPNWLHATDASGKPRLDHEDDFVRMEIVAALQRDIRVIPVLVDRAPMPRMQDLPEALSPLSRREAIELSETHFRTDVNRLIEAIRKSLAFVEKKAEPSATQARLPARKRAPALRTSTKRPPLPAAKQVAKDERDKSPLWGIAIAVGMGLGAWGGWVLASHFTIVGKIAAFFAFLPAFLKPGESWIAFLVGGIPAAGLAFFILVLIQTLLDKD